MSRSDDSETIAAAAMDVLGTGRQIAPFSAGDPSFGLDDAYRVTAAVRRRREARGERVVGRKIGFTNRGIWAEYGVDAPMWGYVYDRTARPLNAANPTFALAGMAEPRIEPEIVLRLAKPPAPGMDDAALSGCLDAVTHGFEIVQSIFPGWKFKIADTVAAFGVHGALLLGPWRTLPADREGWRRALETFEVDLLCDGAPADRGHAHNVLGGPLHALRHLVDVLARDRVNPPLAAGEIITTGTLTRALPVAPGQHWTTRITGADFEGLGVRFR